MQFVPSKGKIVKRIIASSPGFNIYISVFVPGDKNLVDRFDAPEFIITNFLYHVSMKITFRRVDGNKITITVKETEKRSFMRLLEKVLKLPIDSYFYKDEANNLQMYQLKEEEYRFIQGYIGDTAIAFRPSIVQMDANGTCEIGLKTIIKYEKNCAYLTKKELLMLYDAITEISINTAGEILLSQALMVGAFTNHKNAQSSDPFMDMASHIDQVKPKEWKPEDHGSKSLKEDQ